MDGSCIGTPQRAGFGGIIGNPTWFFLWDFHGFITNSDDILFDELSAIYHGLLMARDMDIIDFVCYSNSLLCTNLINGRSSKFHICVTLIQDIKDLLSQSNISIIHTLREGNQCADYFAKLGVSSDSKLTIHLTAPLIWWTYLGVMLGEPSFLGASC